MFIKKSTDRHGYVTGHSFLNQTTPTTNPGMPPFRTILNDEVSFGSITIW